MKFPTAKERREMTDAQNIVLSSNMKKVAKDFVNEVILKKVLYSTGTCVNIGVPVKAHDNIELFLVECKKIIPRDYKVELSHDGGGMETTLCVSW